VRSVALLSVTPVKGFALAHPERVELTPYGVPGNCMFFLVDGDGSRLRSSTTAWPCVVHGEYDAAREVLRMRFPDGQELEGSAQAGRERVVAVFDGYELDAGIVEGPWEEALSALAGHPVRVARSARATYLAEPVTIVSEASIERLGAEAGTDVDGRRFRMLITLAGCFQHEEDAWCGRRLRVGEAVLRVGGPVPRCAATTRDPDTGERDLDALRLIKRYRGLREGKHIDFGVYARVEQPGVAGVGDAAVPL
jgi:uncharacterized protein YcbX